MDDSLERATRELAFYPRLTERYGPANDYLTEAERNAFADGAIWWSRELVARGATLPEVQ